MNKTIEVNNIPKVGNIVITDKLKNKIDYLHRQIGTVEWSGILVYKLKSGNISNMKDLIFEAVDLYPMDIGSSVNTSFTYTPEDVVNMYDSIEDAIEMNIGLIHSHHSMKSYISETDFNEIKNNAGGYNFYISLVVSFDQSYICKIAFPSITQVVKTSTIRNERGESVVISSTQDEESLLLGDLGIVFEEDMNLEDWFITKTANIKKAKTNAVKYRTETFTPTGIYNNQDFYNRHDYYKKQWDKTMDSSTVPTRTIVVEKEVKQEVDVPEYIYLLAGILGFDIGDVETYIQENGLISFETDVQVCFEEFNFADWQDLENSIDTLLYDAMVELYGDPLGEDELKTQLFNILTYLKDKIPSYNFKRFSQIIEEYINEEVKQ